MRQADRALSLPQESWPAIRWFAAGACVVEYPDGYREAIVGGNLVGRFGPREQSIRNALLLGLSEDEDVHLGHLSEAFGVTSETLRILRRVAKQEGLETALLRGRHGTKPHYTEAQRRKAWRLFDEGVGPAQVRQALGDKLSQRTIERLRTAWLAERRPARAATSDTEGGETRRAPTQLELPVAVEPSVAEPAGEPVEAAAPATPVMREVRDDDVRNAPTAIRSASHVQHLGAWLLVAMVARLGLFARATEVAKDRLSDGAVRIALETLVTALALGEKCVEGARRIATPSAGALLRSQWAPSASWTRRILGSLSRELGGLRLHMATARACLRDSRRTPDEPAVFFIDNHLRRYWGKLVVRRGWRMQDKRVVPGTTDYYVHDQDGRPLLRHAVADNTPLTQWLPSIAHTLREVLEAGDKMVLCFDRAGAFPAHLALLRDEDFAFVTYERRPYPSLPQTAFSSELRLGDETVRYVESRINLGKGRGRLRRIALLVPDERSGVRQVNLLAHGAVSAPALIAIIRQRWRQENGLKHGIARWGINQLDGRGTDPYPDDAIIPNPARRRLDRALRAARLREGAAHCKLADLPVDATDQQREAARLELDEARSQRVDLELQRATVPPHAPLADTELAGVLRQHRDEYKVTVDAVRIACANAEAELAIRLAPFLRRPAEAKKLLASLFRCSGRIHAGADHIDVHLQPPGTAQERAAINQLLASLNRAHLTMPGDPTNRPLRFTAQS